MKKGILLLLVVIYLTGCNGKPTNPYNQYSKFPVEKSLTGKVIPIDTILLRYPYRIMVQEDVAVIMDLHNSSHYLHAFKLPDWTYIQSFGRIGGGPDELASCENIRFESLDSLWIVDANRMQIMRWSFEESRDSFTVAEQIPLHRELVRVLDFYVLEDGFLVPDYTGQNRYSTVTPDGRLKESYGKIPTVAHYKKELGIPIANAWRSFMDYNPKNGVLAMATQLGEVLEIYNLKNNAEYIWYGPNSEPEFTIDNPNHGSPNGIMGFGNIQVTDNYIYTVFEGRSFEEIKEKFMKGEQTQQGGIYIYVFDLEGHPVCKYILDHPIYGMYINEEQKTIIATDLNSDDPILIYEMS